MPKDKQIFTNPFVGVFVIFVSPKKIVMSYKKSTIIAFTVAIAFFMQNLDTTAINTAIPAMAQSFGTDVIHVSSGITSYLIALAIFIPVSGWIADRYGTRKVFCLAIGLFILASLLCGTSSTLTEFIIFRIFQGIAGAMMTPVGRLAVLKATPKEDFIVAMNYITLPALVAPILGPLVGGYLTTYWSWHWIFLLNIPFSILCILLAWKYMPEDKAPDSKKRLDVPGFILSSLGLVCFMYGVELFSKDNLSYYIPLLVLAAGIILLYFNFRHSKHISNPLIDYSVLKIKTFRTTIFTGTISRMVIGIAPYLVPLMFQIGFGLNPFQAGSLFVATMVGNLFMKSMTVCIVRHFPFRNILLVNGMLVSLFTLITAFLLPTTPIYLIVLVMFLSGMARSMQFTSVTTLAFADIPQAKMTNANSFYSTIQQMSSGMGIAIGAVALRFSNMMHGGEEGVYSLADFRTSFIFVAVLAFVHLYGYTKLSKTDGDSVRLKK